MSTAKVVKLKKHAELIDQLQNMVRKQAEEAQKNISGVPATDTNPKSPDPKADTTNKNEVGPEKLTTEVKQEGAKEEAGKVVSSGGVKSASVEELTALKDSILNLLKAAEEKKEADAQDTVVGKPAADTKPAGPSESTNTTNKNEVGPEKLTTEVKQEGAKEEAGKTVSDGTVKSSAEDEALAVKIAAYNAGAQLVTDLLRSSGYTQEKTADQKALLKQAGRRDMEIIINDLVTKLAKNNPNPPTTETQTTTKTAEEVQYSEKEAEAAGAAYFDELYKQASQEALIEKVSELEAKLAAVTNTQTAEEKLRQDALAKEAADKRESELIQKIASESARLAVESLEKKLKSEIAAVK